MKLSSFRTRTFAALIVTGLVIQAWLTPVVEAIETEVVITTIAQLL